jgi:hypothetical protein
LHNTGDVSERKEIRKLFGDSISIRISSFNFLITQGEVMPIRIPKPVVGVRRETSTACHSLSNSGGANHQRAGPVLNDHLGLIVRQQEKTGGGFERWDEVARAQAGGRDQERRPPIGETVPSEGGNGNDQEYGTR